jgi:proteasome lid subunit RPN8/RPN11
MLPNIHTVGSVHSHPSGNTRPSEADLDLFSRKGFVHIIVGAPYDLKNWTCYDKDGTSIKLEVVDYEFKDEDFLFEDT